MRASSTSLTARAPAPTVRLGYSGRVGLSQRMTAAGAPAQLVMVQGRWKSAAMVSRYTKAIEAGVALQWL
ncbi:MAG: hypothetical protein OXF54_08630 [Caldilineaceae bacterium]|nr:hypothetical protein [Caldilineaceae bacterium]